MKPLKFPDQIVPSGTAAKLLDLMATQAGPTNEHIYDKKKRIRYYCLFLNINNFSLNQFNFRPQHFQSSTEKSPVLFFPGSSSSQNSIISPSASVLSSQGTVTGCLEPIPDGNILFI